MGKTEETDLLLRDVERYVRGLLNEELPAAYLFNNLDRTLERVYQGGRFADALALSEEEREVLLLALWFRGAGFTRDGEAPLAASADIAAEWLSQCQVDPDIIERVGALIRRSAPERQPETRLDKVMRDVVWSFLGQKSFFGLSNLLRLERESLEGRSYTSHEWQQRMRDRLVNSNYYTEYGRSEFLNRKVKNIAKQRKNLIKAEQNRIRRQTGKDFGRGVDTVYRVAFRNHINLSRIADGKANMIITINTAVLSAGITIGTLTMTSSSWMQDLTQNWPLLLPVVVLMISSLAAVVFAVFSAIPKVSSAAFSEEELENHQVSMLYFGNFLQLREPTFVRYLRELKRDQEILYDDLSRDLYTLGVVLQKKYRLLTIAYRIFVIGLVLSLLTLLVTGLTVLF